MTEALSYVVGVALLVATGVAAALSSLFTPQRVWVKPYDGQCAGDGD